MIDADTREIIGCHIGDRSAALHLAQKKLASPVLRLSAINKRSG